MRTEDLIAVLAADTAPVAAGAAGRRLRLASLGAALAGLVLLWLWLGPRQDLPAALATRAFWMKAGYTSWLAAAGFLATLRLARPGGRIGAAPVAMGLGAVLAMAAMGGMRLMQAPAAERMAMWLGHSANLCPWRILAIAVPTFMVLTWGLRRLAPTRLVLGGAAAGLLAGALAATVYGLACTETSAAFVATWYSLGIAACAGLGAIFGRWALRW